MTIKLLAVWLLHLMVIAIPPGKGQNSRSIETNQAQADRYAQIANAIATVALDAKEAPIYGDGKAATGRTKTAVLLLAVSYFESAWRSDIDLGTTRGDGGKSCTIFQLNLGHGKSPEGWGCDELVLDREKAARAALGAIRRSSLACKREKGPEAVLFAYVAGKCDGDAIATAVFQGQMTVRQIAGKRITLARKWTREHPFAAFAAEHPELVKQSTAL